MSQAWGFYLCLSVCICGLIDGAVDEAGGGEARKLASCRLQVGAPSPADYKSAVPGTLLNWETPMRASLTECKSVVPPCSRWVMVGLGLGSVQQVAEGFDEALGGGAGLGGGVDVVHVAFDFGSGADLLGFVGLGVELLD